MIERILYGALYPILPIVVGIVFKLAFVDKGIPSEGQYEYMIENYGRTMWIELVISSWVLSAGLLLTMKPKITSIIRRLLYWLPIVFFIACVICTLVLPKFGVSSEGWTVWAPAILGFISVFWVGYIITGVSGGGQ